MDNTPKKPSILKKLNYIFDRKQKRQLAGLGVMIFFGGIIETLGVGAMIPVVTAILSPDTLLGYIEKIPILSKICSALSIDVTHISILSQTTSSSSMQLTGAREPSVCLKIIPTV